MSSNRGEASPERWPQLMRQLLDAATAQRESSPAPSSAADDIVALAAHALDLHAGRIQRTRATAEQWQREARPTAPLVLQDQGAKPVPFLGARSTTPLRAGRTVDRKG
jgi:hypothetical protein